MYKKDAKRCCFPRIFHEHLGLINVRKMCKTEGWKFSQGQNLAPCN
jgi:hypothetical protein